jgi:hypothetical protein
LNAKFRQGDGNIDETNVMSSGSSPPRNTFLAEMARGNSEVLARARDLEKLLNDEQLKWQPPTGGWTAGQVLEHLVVAGRLYVDKLDGIMDRARTQGRTRDRQWKPSLMGGVIMRAVAPGNARKYPTQRVFTPGPVARANVVRELIALHEQVGRQLQKADGLNLRAVKLSSPVSPLIRLNLGDAFGILVLHAQRHLLQVGRVINSEGFPGNSGTDT